MASPTTASPPRGKRSRDELEAQDGPGRASNATKHDDGIRIVNDMLIPETDQKSVDSSSDDDIGPALPSTVRPKKKRKLPYEKLYISALPSSPRYSKSLMHKEQLAFVTMTPFTDFLITTSIDGVVKFWKKVAVGIEFVKEFKTHAGEVRAVSVSADGRSFASAGADGTVGIFDVVTFGELGLLYEGIEDSNGDADRVQIFWRCYS